MNAYGDSNDEGGNFYQPRQLSAPKHTEGPWMAAAAPSSILGWPVIAKGGRLICTIATPPNNLKRIGKEAANYEAYLKECGVNAYLIAAAPEMLAALTLTLNHGLAHLPGDVEQMIRRAISKAAASPIPR